MDQGLDRVLPVQNALLNFQYIVAVGAGSANVGTMFIGFIRKWITKDYA